MPQPARVQLAEAVAQPGEGHPRVEGRGAPRVPASAVPSITGVRLKPFGADATLLNISATGALVECTTRLRLGTSVTVVFEGTFSPSSVEGRVARSTVATVSKNGVLRYHVGISFQTRIPLDVEPEADGAARTQVETRHAEPEASAEPRAFASPAASVPFNRW
jgi:hypothetical protein